MRIAKSAVGGLQKAGASPVPKLSQNRSFHAIWVAMSEKQIPQLTEKHREVKVGHGAVGVGRSAPKHWNL